MHNPVLVKESKGVVEGRELLRKLEGQSFPVIAALWHRLPEYDAERLIIVSPEANEGNLKVYMTVQQVLRSLPDRSLQLSDILLIGEDSHRFQELRREIEGVLRFAPPGKKPSLEGYASEDTLIYRWPGGRSQG